MSHYREEEASAEPFNGSAAFQVCNRSRSQPSHRCEMEHEVRVDHRSEVALVRFRDGLGLEELFSVLRGLHAEVCKQFYHVIWDARVVRELVLRPGELERLLGHFSSRMDLSEKAPEVVVVQRPLDFDVAQFYSALAERHGYKVGVCWRMEEALEVLELEELPEPLRRELL